MDVDAGVLTGAGASTGALAGAATGASAGASMRARAGASTIAGALTGAGASAGGSGSVSAAVSDASARSLHRRAGREASETKLEFEIISRVGSRCRHCSKVVKNKQQNGTRLASHLYGCRAASLDVRQMAWGACVTLQNTKPRPIDPPVLSGGPALPPSGPAAGAGGAGLGSQASASQTSSRGVINFLDRITDEQVSTVEAAILNFFVLNRVPFTSVESPRFINLLKTLRPAYVARQRVPSRKKLAGKMLDDLNESTRKDVLQALRDWCTRRKAVFILDAWENVCNHHIINILALIGETAVFLDSIYCGHECQDAAGQARLVQEQLVKYGRMKTFNALASDNAAACIEMRRLVAAANPGLASLNDQAHVATLLIGDLCKVEWIQACLSKALAVSSYVRRHTRLLAAYTAAKDD